MKVLFISSGNSINGISPIVKNQGESLIIEGVNVNYFTINKKGLKSYFRHIFILKEHLRTNKYDVIHAHYSLSAYVASLAGAKPLVVSLMGSDVKSGILFKFLIILFKFLFRWKQIIVKSEDMKKSLKLNDCVVIPNGVDLDLFKPLNKQNCIDQLGWHTNKKHILFAANPNRIEKNFKLAEAAFFNLNNENYELHVLNNVPNHEMPVYFNASDIILLTSLWEGSPNVIKEAMACSRSIVSTNVGDVSWLFGDEEGFYISSLNINEVSYKLFQAIEYSKKNDTTKGLSRIKFLNLDSRYVSNKIKQVYETLI